MVRIKTTMSVDCDLLRSMGLTRLTAPAGEARPGAPLTPILGQQQIKPADFITEFHRLSTGYTPGLPLGCRLYKTGPNKFTLRVAPPALTILLTSAAVSKVVDRNDLYHLAHYRGMAYPAGVSTLLGTLTSLGFHLK
jgi:ribosomal protein L11